MNMTTKNKREETQWKKAHAQAERLGIMLTRRKTGKGEYVCYMNPRSTLTRLLDL